MIRCLNCTYSTDTRCQLLKRCASCEKEHKAELLIDELKNLICYLVWHCWLAHNPAGGNCTPQSMIEGAKFGAKQGWHIEATKDVLI